MIVPNPPKAVITVSEMARLVGLSRARFYQLVNDGVFPAPVYCLRTHRPIYVEELQKVCLDIRRRHHGLNGPVLFYTKHSPSRRQACRKPKAAAMDDAVFDILEGVRALGLTSAKAADVEDAVRTLFPTGLGGRDQGESIRDVFLHLTRQNHENYAGR